MARRPNDFGVRIKPGHEGDDVIDVYSRLPDFRPLHAPQWVVSSQHYAERLREGWPPETGKIVFERRRRRRGAAKGRLLFVIRGEAPIAFVTLHVPDHGPVMIQEAMTSTDLSMKDVQWSLAVLIDCTLEASERLRRPEGAVAWATNSSKTREFARAVFGFDDAPKPKECDRRHYLLLQE